MMNFSIGDTVLVMDEAISGVVIEISGDRVSIQTEDDFVIDFEAKELIRINPKSSLKADIFLGHSANSVISEKEEPKRREIPSVKKKERHQPTMEIDLHIHQLTSKERGMSGHDKLTLQLDTAKRQLDFAISKRIQKLVFIHGVGQGVLRSELEYMVNRYDNVKYYDADLQKYGMGAMEVYIYLNLK